MDLSVIIVNYNVKYFLEQCLYSVQKAIAGMEAEIIVIDNHSTDGSLEYLQPYFPGVRFIANSKNVGFGRACNQGFGLSAGRYCLFLNPDTLIPEDSFRQCVAFMEAHADAGGLGVKMLDGNGKFLKESKRAFPSPVTSLYKLLGLSGLFPRSKIFARYYLGHLDENKDHEVEVLAGAFMMVRREVLESTGGFDESFFMYGEDVDLSYRIKKTTCPVTGGGYRNYYYAGSPVIHFKGESSRKKSLPYIRMFYTAMSRFARKHYSTGRAGMFNILLQSGIWTKALLAAVAVFIRRIGLPVMDGVLILLSFWWMKNIWNNYFRTDVLYESRLLWTTFPVFTAVYLLAVYYAGWYDRQYSSSRPIRSAVAATLVLLAGYSMLPEQYRFSRAIIFFGALLGFSLMSLLRWVLIQSGVLQQRDNKMVYPGTVIVASPGEYTRILQLIKNAGLNEKILGRLSVDEKDTSAIGYYKKIKNIMAGVPIGEVIFCEDSLSFACIIETCSRRIPKVKIKFHAAGSRSIVGSDSKNTAGTTLSSANGYRLADPYNLRLKRLIDVSFSLAAIITFPVQLFIIRRPFLFLKNCFLVLTAQKTWIGYACPGNTFPRLRKGVLAGNGVPVSSLHKLPPESLREADKWYAAGYDPVYDLKLLFRNYKLLGD